MAELTLAIETSNPSSGRPPGVALGLVHPDRVEPLDELALPEGDRHDDLLMPAIRTLLERAVRQPGDLKRIVCSVGPGGYTGLRIATAASNMIALSTGARLFALPSSWVAAGAVRADAPFAVAMASKGDATFLTRFHADATEAFPGRMMQSQEVASLGVGLILGDRFLPDRIRGECERLGIEVREPAFTAAGCLALALRAREVAVGGLVPLYGREAEAVTRWRELHPKQGDL